MLSAAPPASAITPELIAAAKKEGKVVYYTSIDLPLAEKIAKSFEAKFPGIAVRVERTGAERVFQRISQEYASRIYAVDAVNSSDAAHLIVWKRGGLLEPYVPEDVAKHYAADHKDADGMFASFRVGLSVIGCNTDLVKPEDRAEELRRSARSEMEGQDRQGASELQRHHHDRDLPVGARSRLAVFREARAAERDAGAVGLRSAEEARARRARVQADGNEYNLFQLREAGQPVEPLYASEGTPLAVGPNGIFKNAPNPNAARLFQSYCFTAECQQLVIDVGGLRSVHPQTKEKPGHKPLKDIKVLKDDAEGVEKSGEEIRSRYTKLFKV